ncbi:hypothetical protein [Oceanicaulis sp. MMSF_3324]|uniref:hypothetical protein n=1 Tax=Oceanicaulis sp. MMSF_3324 TaxID=3046702 RepID=UPI00273E2CBE|nr:hypothetical protein [Oceanicaulis sp. MMSF_3324]
MSASAITGPSWTPWDNTHAKGAALGEMSLPNPDKTPEDARKTEEAAAAPELSLKDRAGQLNESLSSQLFAALLDQQDFTRANPGDTAAPGNEPANGATSVKGGSANLTDTDAAAGGATGETAQQADENDAKRGVTAQQAASATVIGAQTGSAHELDESALSPALLAQLEATRNPQAASSRLARFFAYS